MKLDSAGYVSIVEIVVFIPALIASIIVCARHGFNQSGGWIYTSLLSIVRIGGVICQLISYNSPSRGVIIAAVIFDSIGLSPLLLSSLGLLSRMNDCINATGSQAIRTIQLRVVQLAIVLATVLCIVGSTSSQPTTTGVISISATVKAGVLVYLAAFLGISVGLFLVLPHHKSVDAREGRIALAVGFALPLIAVRILFSVIAAFANNKHFSIYGGSVGIRVGMATIEEFVVVVMYIALGFTLHRLQKPQEESRPGFANQVWNKSDNDGRQQY
ncbi:hypothetical protein PWT90_07527 [Aphanocladium album]|nr:hypothetical protein PWT90_07527 [Aphanocladium album]